MSPLRIFTEKELRNLLFFESMKKRPNDINEANVKTYVGDLYNLIDGSITEYFFFKKSLLSPNYENKIQKFEYKTAKSEYLLARNDYIKRSEEKFIKENVISLKGKYLACFQKIRTIKYYNDLTESMNKQDIQNTNQEIVKRLVILFLNKIKKFCSKGN